MPYFWIADFWELEPKISRSPKPFSDGLICNCGGKFGSSMGHLLEGTTFFVSTQIRFFHVAWGKHLFIAIQIPGRLAEFESDPPTAPIYYLRLTRCSFPPSSRIISLSHLTHSQWTATGPTNPPTPSPSPSTRRLVTTTGTVLPRSPPTVRTVPRQTLSAPLSPLIPQK